MPGTDAVDDAWMYARQDSVSADLVVCEDCANGLLQLGNSRAEAFEDPRHDVVALRGGEDIRDDAELSL